jgi:hypothetical protein
VPEPDGLDAVPWSRLEHAFGSADDVPEMIRDLRSPSEREREEALEALRTTIWHQETVYSATPHAVPFLARVALDEAVDSTTRLWLVHLLAWISASKGRNAVGRRTQLEHVHAAREALAAFLPRFEAWLEVEEDENLAVAAVALVGLFPERRAEAAPAIRRLLARESDPRRALFYRVALIALGEDEQLDVSELPDDYFDDEARDELAAALAAREDPPQTARRALGELAGHASDL